MERVKIKTKVRPNPLFEQWLLEWRDEAAAKNSDMQYTLGRALRSLKQCPFKLHSGKECIILDSFGTKICQMLDKRLEEHRQTHTENEPTSTKIIEKCKEATPTLDNKKKRKLDNTPVRKRIKKLGKQPTPKESYLPVSRSGGYAILLTLFHKSNEDVSSMTKGELQDAAQPLCDNSFKKPLPGSFYTAWASMGTLLKHQLVAKTGSPAKFSLTEAGMDAAIKLQIASTSSEKIDQSTENNLEVEKKSVVTVMENNIHPIPSLLENDLQTNKALTVKKKPVARKREKKEHASPKKGSTDSASSEPEATIFLLPGNFQIYLLVDIQETEGKNHKNDATVQELRAQNIPFEVRHLNVGDFIWICRDTNGNELVLPYIVERKRMDDLASSIRDGRFHEQKFRLKQCKLDNVIYLVESYGSNNMKLGLPLASLQQACSNTQIIDGFTVKMTDGHKSSMMYLSIMTHLLTNIFKDKTLMSCKKSSISSCNLSDDLISLMTFSEFNKGSGKFRKYTAKEMFMKHLLQLKGLSVSKALVIVEKYPTVASLMEALKQPDIETEILNMKFGALNRLIGPAIAKSIFQLYTLQNLP